MGILSALFRRGGKKAAAQTEELLARLPNAAREIGRAADGSVMPVRPPQEFRRTAARSSDLMDAAGMGRREGPLNGDSSDLSALERAMRKGLPMDEAARLARARRMGFDVDTPLYHGTVGDFDAFDPAAFGSTSNADSAGAGVWLATDPRTANHYADIGGNMYRTRTPRAERDKGPSVLPVYARVQNPMRHVDEGRRRTRRYSDVIAEAKEKGHDAVIFENTFDPVPNTTNMVVFDPRNIRSRFAAFDPEEVNSSDLLASLLGGVMLGGGGLLSARQRERQRA
jgi:hypothetical protein